MIKNFFPLLFLFVTTNIYGQNLVPNPSFELFNNCPKDFIKHKNEFKIKVDNWFLPNKGTTDYLNVCAEVNVGIPLNSNGYQKPFEGNGYIGLSFLPTWYEYVEVELKSELIQNETYEISFWVSLADKSDKYLKNFGALVTKEKIYFDKYSKLPFKPQFINYQFINDTSHWVKIEGIYKAKGGEKFLTIGVFSTRNRDFKSTGRKDYPKNHHAYYYLDMVKVIRLLEQEYTLPEKK